MDRLYLIDNEESQRITVIRAIALIMVVYLHQYVGEIAFADQTVSIARPFALESLQYVISRIITYVAVPVFYLNSSVLLYSKEFTWKENMRKKCKTLILPYILWITVYILIYYIGQHISFTMHFFANTGRDVAKFDLIDYIGAYCGFVGNGLFVNALWFMRDLILLNIMAPTIKKAIDRYPTLIFLITLTYWIINKTIFFNNESICFFVWGYYVVKAGKHMHDVDKLPIGQVGVSYAIMTILQYYFHMTDNKMESVLESLSVIVGIILLILLSKYLVINSNRIKSVLKVVASYSFFIYVSHDMVQIVYKKLFAHFFNQSVIIQLMEYIIIPILTITTCIVFALLLKKLLPKLFVVLSGGR